ncbi:MAG: hypothetical protein EVJ47_02890 [Candidatus Acidulodesulfobacterium ferriphilum]|jgi:hypothetical protein|uniref:Uncharacterized protein n=1 Tax=Candidatus Acidulodesulfobacterium ferriphilum TaxID=2597223 RepID=A0A519BD86_9DELT|nr:MAG: hypothetical protein EVJ47_02890 [Candidatus Acidulodesulfobacterium ferriphilum]
MRKSIFFLIVLSLVFIFSAKAYAGNISNKQENTVKYLYKASYDLGYNWGKLRTKYHTGMVSNERCSHVVSILKNYVESHNMMSLSYYNSIKANLFNTCVLGVVAGYK